MLLKNPDQKSHKNVPITGIYIVSNVCGKTLRNWLNDHLELPPKSSDSFRLTKGLIAAVNHIHDRGKIHRDLRPENVYFSKKYQFPVKVGDFGLSARIQGNFRETKTIQAGNSHYRAPEINKAHPDLRKDARSFYGRNVDHFSLGLMLTEVFNPAPVFELAYKFALVRATGETGLINECHPNVHELIVQLTKDDEKLRANYDSLAKQLPISFKYLRKRKNLLIKVFNIIKVSIVIITNFRSKGME